MLLEIKNKKNLFINAAMLVVLFMCLINESEQQFSYSANWGKRSSPSSGEPEASIGYSALRDLIEFDSQVRVLEEGLKQLCIQQSYLHDLAVLSSQSSTSAASKLNQKLFENALNDIYSNTVIGSHFKTLCPKDS